MTDEKKDDKEKDKPSEPQQPIKWPENDLIKESDTSKSGKFIKRGEKKRD